MKLKIFAFIIGALIISTSIFAGLETLEHNKKVKTRPVPTPEVIEKTEVTEEVILVTPTPTAFVILALPTASSSSGPNSVIFKDSRDKFDD